MHLYKDVPGTGTPGVLAIEALLELLPEQRGGKAADGEAGMERRQAFSSSRFLLVRNRQRRDPEI